MTLHDALAEVHRRDCTVSRHYDVCLALTAGFDELVSQRDLARRVAVSLEQENALLRALPTQTTSAPLTAVEA